MRFMILLVLQWRVDFSCNSTSKLNLLLLYLSKKVVVLQKLMKGVFCNFSPKKKIIIIIILKKNLLISNFKVRVSLVLSADNSENSAWLLVALIISINPDAVYIMCIRKPVKVLHLEVSNFTNLIRQKIPQTSCFQQQEFNNFINICYMV